MVTAPKRNRRGRQGKIVPFSTMKFGVIGIARVWLAPDNGPAVPIGTVVWISGCLQAPGLGRREDALSQISFGLNVAGVILNQVKKLQIRCISSRRLVLKPTFCSSNISRPGRPALKEVTCRYRHCGHRGHTHRSHADRVGQSRPPVQRSRNSPSWRSSGLLIGLQLIVSSGHGQVHRRHRILEPSPHIIMASDKQPPVAKPALESGATLYYRTRREAPKRFPQAELLLR